MPVSDLTGTKWIFNNTFTATAGYGVFDLEAEDAETSGMWSSLYVGYEFDPISQDNNFIQSANNIVWMPAISYPQGEFTITGGTDTTNQTLIAWLEANAEQVVEPAAATFSSFKDISYNATTKALTINGASYTLAATAVGTSVAGGSFSQLTLTSEGVLTIDGVSITLPVYAPVPDHSIVDNTGGYVLDNSTGYLITTERSTTLTAPTISLADTTLSIVDEDGRSMTYDIYVNDAFARNIEAVTGSTTTFDLENLELGVGTHTIKAKAKASGLSDSSFSNIITYIITGEIILDQFTLPDNITDFEFIYDA